MPRIEKSGLQVSDILADFIEQKALDGSGVDPKAFWDGFAQLVDWAQPKNKELLARRQELQSKIDEYHKIRNQHPIEMDRYKMFLQDIGYLVEDGDDFEIETTNVDP